MKHKLTELVTRVQQAFGGDLVSIVLYGSAAVGDWNEKSSDVNILCVLTQVTVSELKASEPVFHWWREQGNPPPLLMSAEEVRGSTDCFPMEFHDMQAHRRVLSGEDVIDGLEIDRSFYRAQVEHELRAKQLRLRQQAAEVLAKPDALLRLLTDSVSTFCVLGRHALILSGREPRWRKREVVEDMERVLELPFDGFQEILALRAAGKATTETNAVLLFEKYLKEVGTLVSFVDRLDK